jgi:hypothetical protein
VLAVGVECVSHRIAEAPRVSHVEGPPCGQGRQAGSGAGRWRGETAIKVGSGTAASQPAGMLCLC